MVDLQLYAPSTPHTCNGISVILPLRGIARLSAIQSCIHYLRLQNISPFEIISVEEDAKPLLNIATDNHIFLPSTQRFNKSCCINCGVSNAKYENICMLDADMIVPNGYLKRICEVLEKHDAGHLVKDIFYLSNVPQNNVIDPKYSVQWIERANFNCHGGSIFFKKQAFVKSGGMDERFVGNGSEDSEFYFRIKQCCDFYDIRESTLLHMPHDYRDLSNVAQNLQIWESTQRLPLEVTVKNLQNDLKKWNLYDK